ncbi:MAG: GAF domain-containing protein [Bryobacteraceae bacterium]
MTQEQFERVLRRLLAPLSIDMITIYTPDPWGVDDNYRLLWMDGVRDRCPMFGPVVSDLMRRRLLDEPQRITWIPNILESRLFQRSTFAKREGVRSLVRLHLLTTSPHAQIRPGAVVFLGTRVERSFDLAFMSKVDAASSALEAILAELGELGLADATSLMQQTRALAQSARTTHQVIAHTDLDNAIAQVLRSVLHISRIDDSGYCSIYLLEPNGHQITCRYRLHQGNFEGGRFGVSEVGFGHGLFGNVVAAQRSLVLNDVTAAAANGTYVYTPPVGCDCRPRSSVAVVPMRAHGRVIGVLSVVSPIPDLFGSDDLRILEMLSDAASLAIFENQYRHRTQWLLKSSVDPQLSLPEVIQTIKAHVRDEIGADEVEFWFYEAGRFWDPVQPGSPDAPRSRLQDKEGGGTSEWLLLEGVKQEIAAIVAKDINHRDHVCNFQTARNAGGLLDLRVANLDILVNSNLGDRVLTSVGIPVTLRDQPKGVFWVNWYSDHQVSLEDLELLVRFAQLASLQIGVAEILENPHRALHQHVLESTFGKTRAAIVKHETALMAPRFYPAVASLVFALRWSPAASLATYADVLHDTIQEFLAASRAIVHTARGCFGSPLASVGNANAFVCRAVFGAPDLSGDETAPPPAVNAANAALALLRHFEENRAKWREKLRTVEGKSSDVKLFAGLAFGPAVVGNFAPGYDCDFVAIGQTPALAYHLHRLAAESDRMREIWPRAVSFSSSSAVLCTPELGQMLLGQAMSVVPLRAPHYRIDELGCGVALATITQSPAVQVAKGASSL